jgi:hypothetical protein
MGTIASVVVLKWSAISYSVASFRSWRYFRISMGVTDSSLRIP